MPDERPVAIANTSPLQYLEEEPRIVVTPSGLECVPNTAKDHENSGSPTESLLPPQPKKRFTKREGSKVAKLAILSANAVRNADLHRALELIEEIRAICEGAPAEATNLQVVR
jgi:hypothetical protein